MTSSDRTAIRQGYVIYAVLCAGLVASQFFRVSNAVIAPELMADLAIGTETMGVVNGTYFLAFAAMQIPAGMLLDRYGARRMVPGLFVLAVAGSVLYAAAQSGPELIAGRALIGIGCALGLMGPMVVIARWFEPERYARLISLLFTVGGLGSLMASTPLAAVSEAIGWRGAFYLMAVLTGVIAVLIYLIVRDAPPGSSHEGPRRETMGEMWRGLREVLALREMWWICAVQFVSYGTMLTIVGLWAGPYLNDVHGLRGVDRGNALLGLNILLFAAVMLFSQTERWLDSRKKAVMGGGCAAVAVLLVLAFVPGPGLWAALALLALFTMASAFFMLIHAHARAILPDRLIGRGLTLQNLSVMLGVFVIQALTGVIVGSFGPEGSEAPEIAYRAAFGFLALSLAAGLAFYARIADVSPRGSETG
ncbi:MAG: MFS transporter [Defluviicoccus sp.]|nr:MFS transporter [Defluviicoccus sp.]MDE0279436.1 MFS transporter [Defluviicoccus sp.]